MEMHVSHAGSAREPRTWRTCLTQVVHMYHERGTPN